MAGLQSSITSLATNANANTAAYLAAGISTNVTTTGNISAGNILLNGAPISIGTVNPDYIHAGRITSDQTGIGAGSDVIFNSTVVSSGVSMNTSTGVFTLTANKTYRLFGSVSFVNFSSATGWLIYQWVDATTNTALDTSGISVGVAEALNRDISEFNATSAQLIYTPSTNQTIKLRITDGGGTATIRSSIGTKATIEQINPTFALQSNITFANITATGNLTVGGNVVQQSAYYERYGNVSNTGGNLTCNFNNGTVFYANLSANVTANFTNVNAISSTVTGATIIVDQGATAYRVANVQVNGVNQTVKWVGATAGAGTASNTDIMSFSLINLGGGAYRVLGQISNYG